MFLHFSSLFFIFRHFSSFLFMFFMFLQFSSCFSLFLIFFIFLHFLHFSPVFSTFLHFLYLSSFFCTVFACFFTFRHFSSLFSTFQHCGEKWGKVATKTRFLSMCHLCVCVCTRHLRWHVDRNLCFVVSSHFSSLFFTFLHFSSLWRPLDLYWNDVTWKT